MKLKTIFTILKYAFSFILTFAAFINVDTKHYLVIGTLELLIIFIVSDICMFKKVFGRIVNSILLLLYNAQMFILLFGSSYITVLMLTNLHSLEALSGKMVIYVVGVIVVLIFTFWPIEKIEWKKLKVNMYAVLSVVLALELGFVMLFGNIHSPMFAYYNLLHQFYEKHEMEEAINSTSVATIDFYKDGVENFYKKDDRLPKTPNIILIFTEGLSQNVISDERNIMPNVEELQSKSLSFINYYNHTFATYRGIIGQLFSGYQLNDFDVNKLVSIQSVLADEGYDTFFINTEPNNKDFTEYLNNLGFDEIVGDTGYECSGMADSISDKNAYEILYDTALEESKSDEPFFIAMYTFGTHASLDSVDQKFGNGDDAELNKFYDADYQFGAFMDKFENSSFYEDTIIIYTADHATYVDDSFKKAFPDYERNTTTVDAIPFFIYYSGIAPVEIDVKGRNTLNMVPTVLDYLDISAENYFIGSSLFSSSAGNMCETSYFDSNLYYSSKYSVVSGMSAEEQADLKQWLTNYYITRENQ